MFLLGFRIFEMVLHLSNELVLCGGSLIDIETVFKFSILIVCKKNEISGIGIMGFKLTEAEANMVDDEEEEDDKEDDDDNDDIEELEETVELVVNTVDTDGTVHKKLVNLINC